MDPRQAVEEQEAAWMNPGTMKLSTIQSVKGWEIDTLVVIVDESTESEGLSRDELVYTAITRCRNNLLILN